MFEINLIKDRAITLQEIKKYKFLFFVILSICISLITIIFFIFFILSDEVEKLQQDYASETEKLQFYENKYQHQKKVIETIFENEELIKLISEKDIISYKLKTISDFLPEGMFVNNFNLNEGTITLDVYVLKDNVDNIKKFISDLEKEKVFKQINIESSQMVKLDNEDFFLFRITIK